MPAFGEVPVNTAFRYWLLFLYLLASLKQHYVRDASLRCYDEIHVGRLGSQIILRL